MRIHFIAIGGSIMHSLAIALQAKGHQVSGSDDHIYDPAKSRLEAAGLLPQAFGWFPERITEALGAVVLGMHAKADNPELQKANELGLRILTYPELVYEHAQNQQRIVVGGSHGKTSVTSMIIHALNYWKRPFDYIVGAVPQGLESTVRLSADAPIIVVEGDEYPTSPLDKRGKFIHYQHHIGVVTGIAWDHANVYPTEESYLQPFKQFVEQSPKAGALVYCQADKALDKLVKSSQIRHDVALLPYNVFKHKVKDGRTFLQGDEKQWVEIQVFGEHNLLNISAAQAVCERIGMPKGQFLEAIASFKGAKMRLELLGQNANARIFRDFAHAPSKLKATINAVKEQFGKDKLLACMELHTYSSLNAQFIGQYKDSMKKADTAVVYYSPKTVALKGLPALSERAIKEAFGRADLQVFTDSASFKAFLERQTWKQQTLLLMSSGNYDGLDLEALKAHILA